MTIAQDIFSADIDKNEKSHKAFLLKKEHEIKDSKYGLQVVIVTFDDNSKLYMCVDGSMSLGAGAYFN